MQHVHFTKMTSIEQPSYITLEMLKLLHKALQERDVKCVCDIIIETCLKETTESDNKVWLYQFLDSHIRALETARDLAFVFIDQPPRPITDEILDYMKRLYEPMLLQKKVLQETIDTLRNIRTLVVAKTM